MPDDQRRQLPLLIASVGGVGNLPIMPGTWASFVVIIPALIYPYITDHSPAYAFGGLAVVAIVLSLWSIPSAQAAWGHDPSRVVVDEVAGMALMLADPVAVSSPWWVITAFFVFRLYDVFKPWPINLINARTSAWSVLADDLLAAVYGLFTVHMLFTATQYLILWQAS